MKPVMSSNVERGSALLIVFVFAATIAILLYMEMPVAVFEAQRNKEQALIDHGSEYAHGVKLFVRKTGQYPPSFDALENTNRMRFLRRRYKDPFTGKDDWRLLHAGPNGLLIDSKVNPVSNVTGAGNSPLTSSNNNSNTPNGTNSSFGGGNSAKTGSSNPFNSSFSGFNDSSPNTPSDVAVPSIPQRPPAIAANGASSSSQDQNGLIAEPPFSNTTNQTAAMNSQTLGPDGRVMSPNQQKSANAVNPQAASDTQSSNGNQATPGKTTNAGASSAGSSSFTAFSSTPSSSSGMGVLQSGGIAGVASKASGHTIKSVNDQENYSLWEFYYDPTKEAQKNLAGAMAQTGGRGGNSAGNSSLGANNSSGFGSNSQNTNNGFGNNNSGFGSGLSGMQNNNSSFGSVNSNSGNSGGFGSTNNSSSSQRISPANSSPNPPQ